MSSQYDHSNRIWGGIFIVAGSWWLLSVLGLVPFQWNVFGPLAIIAAGISMWLGRSGRCFGGARGAESDDERIQ